MKTHLFFSLLLLLSGTECGQIFHFFGRIKRQPKAWWSDEVQETVSERRKAFATAHKSDEDFQTCISAFRRASSVIAKAEAWQATFSSLLNLCILFFVLSLALPPPNFSNLSFQGVGFILRRLPEIPLFGHPAKSPA